MSAASFLTRWTLRKAEAAAPKQPTPEPPAQSSDAAAPAEPPAEKNIELDLDKLRSLWAQNPAIGLPDGLDLDCGNFDDSSAEKAFADLWNAGRKVAEKMAESSIQLETEPMAGKNQSLV